MQGLEERICGLGCRHLLYCVVMVDRNLELGSIGSVNSD